MNSEVDCHAIRLQMNMSLLARGWKLRERLRTGDTTELKWVFDERCAKFPFRKGHLIVWRDTADWAAGRDAVPGTSFTSSMGANSDDSYSGFLPHVTFDEALLLVYKPWRSSIE